MQAQPQPQANKPQAAPVQTTAPQPIVRATAAAGGLRVDGLNTVSIKATLSGHPAAAAPVATAQKQATAPQQPIGRRAEAYTDEDFKESWRIYVRAHKKESLLYNAMIAGFPERTDGDNYVFSVSNPAQKEKMESMMHEILQSIRGTLKNDNVMLTIKVMERRPEEKVWTQRELMTEAAQRNHKVLEFIKKYRLSMI